MIPSNILRITLSILFGTITAFAQEAGRADSIRVNVDAVQISVSATQHGIPVRGLTKDDFQIREDGKPQVLQSFWQELDLRLTVGLIVDVSASQAGLMGKHRETVTTFLHQVLGPRDKAMLITVGTQARLVTDLTTSIDELGRGIDRIKLREKESPILGETCQGAHKKLVPRRRLQRLGGCGGTALWQGVYAAAKLKMKNIEGRKALIVLSDGWDTGSDRSLEDAIEAAQSAETAVYTIKFTSAAAGPFLPVVALRHGMDKLSDETGGSAYGLLHGDMHKVFQQIEEDLRNLYVLGYTPANAAHDGTFRKIEVIPSRKDIQIRTRKGYVAARQ